MGTERPAVKAGAKVGNKLETASVAAEAPEMGRTGWAGDVEGEDAGRKIAQPERRPGLGLDREVAVISQSKGYTRETMFVEEGAELRAALRHGAHSAEETRGARRQVRGTLGPGRSPILGLGAWKQGNRVGRGV